METELLSSSKSQKAPGEVHELQKNFIEQSQALKGVSVDKYASYKLSDQSYYYT